MLIHMIVMWQRHWSIQRDPLCLHRANISWHNLSSSHPRLVTLRLIAGTVVGGLSDPATGGAGHATFGPGVVVAVPESALHSAENPSCTEPVVLLQAQNGGVRSLVHHASMSFRPCIPVLMSVCRRVMLDMPNACLCICKWMHSVRFAFFCLQPALGCVTPAGCCELINGSP